jgi:hypothetical protein
MFAGQLINLLVDCRTWKKAESSIFITLIVGSLADILIQRDTLTVSFSTFRRSVREAAPCFLSSKFLIDFAHRFVTRQFDNLYFA